MSGTNDIIPSIICNTTIIASNLPSKNWILTSNGPYTFPSASDILTLYGIGGMSPSQNIFNNDIWTYRVDNITSSDQTFNSGSGATGSVVVGNNSGNDKMSFIYLRWSNIVFDPVTPSITGTYNLF